MRSSARVAGALVVASLLALGSGARAESVQKGGVRVAFSAKLAPTSLPREGYAPVAVSVGGKISTVDGSAPPPLRRMQIAINRYGRLDAHGLPRCRLEAIQPASNATALAACRSSLVGEGSFSASVSIPEQSPFPSTGKILAFNGVDHGRPVIFAHIYGTEPVPTSLTLPLRISAATGTFATVLTTSLPEVASNIAYVSSIDLRLSRTFSSGGRRRGYLSAGCPAPAGFSAASFPLMRASFTFEGSSELTSTLIRSCQVGGRRKGG
jgi:hypothetical protein